MLSTCEQEDFRSPGPHSDDEAGVGGDPGYESPIVPAPSGQLPVGARGASEEGKGLSPWTGEARERLMMPPPAAAGRKRSSRGAGTRPGHYKAMHNGQ